MKIVTTILGLMVAVLIIASTIIPITDSYDGKSIDVLLIDGQSNGAYEANSLRLCNPAVVNDVLDEPKWKALYYGTEVGSSKTVTEDSTIREMYREGEWKIGGEEAGLAYYLMEKNHRDVLVLNIAVSSTGIKSLAQGAAWTNGKTVLDTALDEIKEMYDKVYIRGLVMIHGEADKTQTVSYYEKYFMILFDNLNEYGFDKCYFVLPRYSRGGNAYDAMLDLAKNNNNIYTTGITSTFTIENGLLNDDDLHYTQLGRIVISETVVKMLPTSPNFDSNYYALMQIIPLIMLATLAVIAGSAIYMKRGDE